MKLEESKKEALPIGFLTNFVSKGWDEVGNLKENIRLIKEEFKGTKKVEELIQSLIDAYLVCIGQIEAHMEADDYLEYPEESALAEKTLQEDVNIDSINIGKIKMKTELEYPLDNECETENKNIVKKVYLDEPENCKELEPTVNDCDKIESEEYEDRVNSSSDSESFEYFCDFDEPDLSEPKLTDDDLKLYK